MVKPNQTTSWPEGKPAVDIQLALSGWRKHAKRMQQRHKEQESFMKLRIQAKIAKNKIKKKEKECKVAEKKGIIKSVLS